MASVVGGVGEVITVVFSLWRGFVLIDNCTWGRRVLVDNGECVVGG